MSRWQKLVAQWQKPLSTFDGANAEAIGNTVLYGDPQGPKGARTGGACVVLNMAAADIPDFCRDGYKNIYQLAADKRPPKAGEDPPKVSETRIFVDKALQKATGIDPAKIYFAAIELTGTGIRFYGDICLVLKRDQVDRNMQLLDRNSYDLVRDPIKQVIGRDDVKCAAKAQELRFDFDPELQYVAIKKVMEQTTAPDRRLTAGEIAERLRADEDYIEVLWQQPIDVNSILEARTSASDAAAEALTATQLRTGPAPSLEQMTSRAQRSAAQKALRRANIPFRVVTTSGRIRG